jgi:hypothetical protein
VGLAIADLLETPADADPCGGPGHNIAIFLDRGGSVFLQGFLRKYGGRLWFFDG